MQVQLNLFSSVAPTAPQSYPASRQGTRFVHPISVCHWLRVTSRGKAVISRQPSALKKEVDESWVPPKLTAAGGGVYGKLKGTQCAPTVFPIQVPITVLGVIIIITFILSLLYKSKTNKQTNKPRFVSCASPAMD